MNNLIIFMALGGTIPFGIYLLLRYKFHLHYKNPTLLYRLLHLSIFFYLFPVPLFSNDIKDFLRFLFNNDSLFLLEYRENVEMIQDMGKYFQKLSDGRVILPQYKMLFIVCVMIWFCVSMGLFIKYYRNYKIQRNKILANSCQPSSALIEQGEAMRKELCLKQHIQLKVMDGDFAPFTLGVLKPVIVFPAEYPSVNVRLVLMHEYIHIKKFDALIQVLGNIVIILHWYLLFVYLLIRELSAMAELDCDYKVSTRLSEQQVKRYGHLIINSNEIKHNTTNIKSPFISSFSNCSKNLTKERLIMLKNRRSQKISILLAFIILTAFFSTVSAAGYNKPAVFVNTINNIIMDNGSFTPQEPTSLFSEDEILFSEASTYFISQDGTVSVPDEASTYDVQSCSHSYVTGDYKTHVLNVDGSCNVDICSAKRCTKCANLVIEKHMGNTTYPICPH